MDMWCLFLIDMRFFFTGGDNPRYNEMTVMLALVFLKLFINPLHPRSALIEDFTLSSTR